MPWMEQLRSANWSQASCIALAAYLLGCFTTGYYLVRLRLGQDIRDLGSGSVGARNVGRQLGWQGFLVTVLGDGGKGALAVWAARHFTTDNRLVLTAMVAVVVGHVWPVQLHLRGGKGMATALGALIIYDYRLVLAFALLFAAVFATLRKTVLPGLFALACLPLMSWYLAHSPAELVGTSVLVGVVLLAHRKNLVTELSLFFDRRSIHPEQHPPEL
jgi:acyl phosphate:glycerol-3-phosphate acyltransferase